MNQSFLVLAIILAPSLSYASASPIESTIPCITYREYITAHQFLKEGKTVKVGELETKKISEKVALGCEGAASRFIRVLELVAKAGVAPPDALSVAEGFSARSEAQTQAFLEIFKRAYVSDDLDLTVKDALEISQMIALKTDGQPDELQKDFVGMADFCNQIQSQNLPKAHCGRFAARILAKANPNDRKLAPAMSQLFLFANKDPQGPSLGIPETLKLTEELLANGSESATNFVELFQYALSADGLKMTKADAFQFAQRMSIQKVRKQN